MPEIHIYTDGSALGNPGPGGYDIIIEWVGKGYIKEFSRGFKYTTNNRMELWAVIDALEKLKKKPMDVLVISDSKYVIEAVDNKWVYGWQKKNFKGKKNPDLWKRFLKIYPQHNVQFQWVKGHNDHPKNERCDQLAVSAAKEMAIEQDTYYEQMAQKA